MNVFADWRDASQYPNPNTVSNVRLAWEFLRRNPDYLKCWNSYLQVLRFAAGDDSMLSRLVDCYAQNAGVDLAWLSSLGVATSNELHGRLFDHPALTHSEDGPAGRRVNTPLARHLAKRWGIDTLHSPTGHSWMGVPRFVGGGIGWTVPTSHGVRMLEESHGGYLSDSQWLVLQIDLRLPLNVIKERTAWAVQRAKRYRTQAGHVEPIKHRARPPALLVEYLRILDAIAAGMSLPDIGGALHPRAANDAPEYARNHRTKAAHTEAVRMRDEGYRALPFVQDKNTGRHLRRELGKTPTPG